MGKVKSKQEAHKFKISRVQGQLGRLYTVRTCLNNNNKTKPVCINIEGVVRGN
jgi:hypothetical protein